MPPSRVNTAPQAALGVVESTGSLPPKPSQEVVSTGVITRAKLLRANF